ncbi:hypothetical protein CDL15_Pgr007995 [Punica granatum]|uniref:Uncharacterized protein n=1 Tax=Punica granatum TaxID=22663 RepID=A0A218VRZ2_PUNGR|nr:hypothetical protein CDL15_Pgr007995 [Punica granatum]
MESPEENLTGSDGEELQCGHRKLEAMNPAFSTSPDPCSLLQTMRLNTDE